MSTRTRRTLVEDSPPRRSPRLSSKDVSQRTESMKISPKTKKRLPTTPPTRAKQNLIPIPRSPEYPAERTRAEFSEDEFTEDEIEYKSKWNSLKASIWESLMNESRNKDRNDESVSWSKRNLFAVFVLLPLILLFISLLVWNMINGINLLDGMIGSAWTFVKLSLVSLLPFQRSNLIKVQGQTIDVDLLIDRILANDKFNEIVSLPNSDSERLMHNKLDTMEKEIKAAHQSLLDEMSKKVETYKTKIDHLKNSATAHDYEKLKQELDQLKVDMDRQGTSDDRVVELRQEVQSLTEKQRDLAEKLAKCQGGMSDKNQIESDLKEAMQNALTEKELITKEELTRRLSETQQEMMYGLESEVLEKVRADPVIMDKMANLALKNGQKFSKDDVVSIVHEALTVYDADKTGLFDFALESAGGTIASIRCTETYDVTQAVYHIMGVPVWWERQNPRKVIQPGSSPGQCWAFKGSQGCVVIKLSTPVYVSEVTLEHIPKSLSPDGNIASAPRNFEVLGLEDIDDPNPAVLGNFTYDINNLKNPVQTFKVSQVQKRLTYIEMKVLSNYGHPEYTCLYRFRVHGNIEDKESTNV